MDQRAAEVRMREILLVEDLESDAELLRRVLKAARVSNPIRHLMDGSEAFAYLKALENVDSRRATEIPSVLFLDLKLPGSTGFEILRYLRDSSTFAGTLKFVVSDLRDMDGIRHAYALGAHSFVRKPVNAQDLQELIKTYPKHWEIV